jgi:Family of unknown function (DUF6535)
MSLSCALLATSLHQWARRYLRLTQPPRCSPEKRARMRAFFADGADKMHVPWAVEGLPTLLHLSLFLFFGGLVIFLFHVDRKVFGSVVWWIGLFSMVYVSITLLPLIRQDSPYYAPLSTPAWFLYAGIPYVTFKILHLITTTCFYFSPRTWTRCTQPVERWYWIWVHWENLSDRYRRSMLGGVERAAEETASERSSEIDIRIFDWTIGALGDDISLEKFFEAIPGFVNSKLVHNFREHLSDNLLDRLSEVAHGFLGRTWSSNLINNSEKLRRLDVAMDAMGLIRVSDVSSIFHKILFEHWDDVPHSMEMGHTLARWCANTNQSVALYAQSTIARILGSVRERDDSWITIAARVFGLPERDIRDNIALGDDSVLLAIFIHVTRRSLRSDYSDWEVLEALSNFDIRNTLPRLQHDFCPLWNEIVQDARKQEPFSTPVYILQKTRHLYIALHQGTDAALTAFSASTEWYDEILHKPTSYPFCNLASHRPDSIAQFPVPSSHQVPLPSQPGNSPDLLSPSPADDKSTVPQQAKQTIIIAGLPALSNLTTTGEIGETFQSPNTTPLTNPAHSSPYPTGGVAATTQTLSSTTTLPHPQEGSEQQDVVAPCAEPDISQILSIGSTHWQSPTPTLVPVPISQPPVLDTLESCDSGAASASNSLLAATSVVVEFSNPVSPPSHVLSSPNTEFIALLSSTTPSYPTGNATLPHLRARGLANSGDMCFANAVLQILVRSPPFWNLFKGLGSLKGQRGGGISEIDGGVIPLVDATTRFIGEFLVKEKESPPIQQPPRQVAGETRREDEEKKEHNALDTFDPTYMYDAMKEKRQLKDFLVRFCVT